MGILKLIKKLDKLDFNQSGQILIIMLLVIVVVLAIGLSVVGRSNTEVSTATQIENSARAFSAAEGGIEHILALSPTPGGPGTSVSLLNSSSVNTYITPYPNASVASLEQKKIGNDQNSYSFAQFWFANPLNITDQTGYDHAVQFGQPANANLQPFDIYFGNPQTPATIDQYPAIEVHIIYWNNPTSSYQDQKYYFDSAFIGGTSQRTGSNALGVSNYSGCIDGIPSPLARLVSVNTNFGSNQQFFCKVRAPSSGNFSWSTPPDANNYPILMRIRVLYTTSGQNVAIGPDNACITNNGTSSNNGCSFPIQTNVFVSTGSSAYTQRTIQVTQEMNVMPYIFDFAMYSQNAAISK